MLSLGRDFAVERTLVVNERLSAQSGFVPGCVQPSDASDGLLAFVCSSWVANGRYQSDHRNEHEVTYDICFDEANGDKHKKKIFVSNKTYLKSFT